jgi:transposase InsO family protein
MSDRMPFRKASAGPRDSSDAAIWNVGWRKFDNLFELCVADATSGTTLVSRALKPGTVAPVLGVIEEAIRQFGMPREIRTDYDTDFVSSAFRELLASRGIDHSASPPGGR